MTEMVLNHIVGTPLSLIYCLQHFIYNMLFLFFFFLNKAILSPN